MCGQHQLNIHIGDFLTEVQSGDAFFLQTVQQIAEHGTGVVLQMCQPPPTDPVLLLGDIGQIQKLIESAYHRYQRIIRKVLQQTEEFFPFGVIAQPGFFGLFADQFDLLHHGLTVLRGDGLPQQLPQHFYFVAQDRIKAESVRLTHGNVFLTVQIDSVWRKTASVQVKTAGFQGGCNGGCYAPFFSCCLASCQAASILDGVADCQPP